MLQLTTSAFLGWDLVSLFTLWVSWKLIVSLEWVDIGIRSCHCLWVRASLYCWEPNCKAGDYSGIPLHRPQEGSCVVGICKVFFLSGSGFIVLVKGERIDAIGSRGKKPCAARVSGTHYIFVSESKNTSPHNIALPMWSGSLHEFHVTEGSRNCTLTGSVWFWSLS